MKTEITGTIYKVGDVQEFGSNGFKKREVVVNTGGEYPQYMPISITKDKAVQFNGAVGQTITVSVDLRGRSWTNPQGEEKFFVDIEGWKWDLEGSSTPTVPKMPEAVAAVAEDDEPLPF